MAKYLFIGATHAIGKPKLDANVILKVPKTGGSFTVIRDVKPGATVITITDPVSIAHVEGLKDLHGVLLFRKIGPSP